MIEPLIIYLLVSLSITCSLILVYKIVLEKDLVKIIMYLVGKSIMYTLILILLASPDLVAVYIILSTILYPIVFLTILSKTRFVEEMVKDYE